MILMPDEVPTLDHCREMMLAGGSLARASWMWNGLRAWWPFASGGGSDVLDFSGNGNHGTLSGSTASAAWAANDSEKFDFPHVLAFDGVDDYVPVPDSPSLSSVFATNRMTISLWLRWNGTPTLYDSVITHTTGTGWTDGWGIYWATPTAIRFWVTTFNLHGSFATVVPGEWNHIVGTYDGEVVRTYANGTLGTVGAGSLYTGSITDGGDTLEIGRARSNLYNLSGWLGDVRLHDRATSAAEVADLHDHGRWIVESLDFPISVVLTDSVKSPDAKAVSDPGPAAASTAWPT